MKRIAFLLFPLALLIAGGGAASAQSSQGKLIRVVMLMRHGVRAPTQSTEELDRWHPPSRPSLSDWPNFGVPPGDLTPKGWWLVKQLGQYYRSGFDQKGLFQGNQCPDGVFIYADRDERTLLTAQALATGLMQSRIETQRCHFEIQQAAVARDPLFHPTEDGNSLPPRRQCKLDQKNVRNLTYAVNPLKDLYAPQLAELTKILCSGKAQASCVIDANTSVAVGKNGKVSISGGLGVAQSFAEILLLEYAEGFEGDNFGFGIADKDKMLDTLAVHTAVFNAVQRNDVIDGPEGADLAYHLAYAVATGRDPMAPSNDKNKILVYVGHDTNIANVAGLLGLHWSLPPYPQDDIPPGSAIVFEVWRRPDGSEHVHALIAAQLPRVMHPSPGSPPAARPAEMVSVGIPGCGTADKECTVDAFYKIAAAVAADNQSCLTSWPPPQISARASSDAPAAPPPPRRPP